MGRTPPSCTSSASGTDPVVHALWAGIAGYFVGLAVQGYKRGGTKQAAIALGCVGLGIAAVLHGLNDWTLSTSANLGSLPGGDRRQCAAVPRVRQGRRITA